jgi:DNA helicase-2/ATP-dependent DNA helicase PcrA
MTFTPSPEQLAVVDHPLSPLRINAGAGTGKTTTMALRLGVLIEDGSVAPEEALGITFTNKAAEELADRLRHRLGELAADGREVEVATYHGFALGLLREFGALVGVERSAGLITPGYARQLLTGALTAAPRLDLTATGRRVDELAVLGGQLGDHLLSANDLIAAAPADAGEVWADRLEMARALEWYTDRKRALGLVDYADLITEAYRLVSEHPEIGERIRERYRVVLLDEYQDTNPAQRQLLRSIFGGGFPVTAVGDPDQTIYEWRGASLENFAAFPDHFAGEDGTPATTMPLSINHRSDRRIIEFANRVRSQISANGGLDALRHRKGALDGSVRAGWFRSALDEARWIAGETVRLHETGFRWSEIAVLFRAHRQIGLVREALERQGVPVEVASLGGLLEVPEVADLHAWLTILDRPDDSPSLMRILLGPFYRLGLGDLAPLAAWVRRRRPDTPDDDLGGIGWALLEAIEHLDECPGLDDEPRRRLVAFHAAYRSLLEAAQAATLVDLCRMILDQTGAWPEIEALDDAARLSARLNLYRFLDLAEEWSPLEGGPSLEAFLDYLDLLREERGVDALDTARVSGADAVALVTVHRSKGLEWPVVFLPALSEGTFPAQPRVYPDPVLRAQFVPFDLRLDAGALPVLPEDESERKELLRGLHHDQEWRTAYVAVTRAAHHVVCTGAYWYSEKKPKKPGPLFELAAAVGDIVTFEAEAGEPPPTLRFEDATGDGPDPAFPEGWRTTLRLAVNDPDLPRRLAEEDGRASAYDASMEQLRLTLDGIVEPTPADPGDATFRTSVTGLVTYAACPKRFYWSEIDRLPRRPSAGMRRGVEIHRRIELHNRGTMALEEVTEDLYDVGPGEGGAKPEDAYAAFLSSRFATERPLLVEAPFDLSVGDGRIAGRIDAVYEPNPGTWEVVDFKSGRRSDDPARRVQLQAYAVAVHDAGFAEGPPDRVRVAFVYLGGGLEEVVEEVDPVWMQASRDRLEALVGAAASGEYGPTPSAACRHCDFTRFCPEGTSWLEAAGCPDGG